jgi:hypothetical protein
MAQRRPYKARKDSKAGDPAAKPKCCKGEEKKAEDACSIDAKENTSFVENQKERNKKREKYNAKPKNKKKKDIYSVREMTWKDKHCMNTLFDYENTANVKKNIENLKDELNELKDDFDNVLIEFGKGVVVDKVEKVVAVGGCAVVGGAVGAVVGFFFGGAGAVPGAVLGAELGGSLCGAAATADTVLDAANGAKEILNNKDKIAQKIEELSNAKKQVNKLNKTVTDLKNASETERKALKQKIYEEMGEQIGKDPCLKAKRCELKPYKDPRNAQRKQTRKEKQPMDKIFDLGNEAGCCPGQQAHHVIPSVKVQQCKGYDADKAPTVCVEGGKETGTHGKMHSATDDNTEDMVYNEGEYKNHTCAKETATMNCTIEASAQAMVDVFSDSKCDKKCIKQQLEKFYDKLCKGQKMTPMDKNGDEIKRGTNTQEGNRK